MTVPIPLSQIGDAAAFAARVAAFRKAKLDHQKTVDVPAPREHELVEACVRRVPRATGAYAASLLPREAGCPAAGEGQDEGARRRRTFSTAPHPNPLPQAGEGVRRDSGDAATSLPDDYEIVDYEIVDDRPSLRARKDALIHQLSEQEHALMIASMAPGKRRLAGLRAHEIHQKPVAERSDVDKQFLAETQARLQREAAIGRHAAEQMAAIEDLTEATIDGWQPAPFPGIRNQQTGIKDQEARGPTPDSAFVIADA